MLGCGTIDVDIAAQGALYRWAQLALETLAADAAPKLKLAEALGFLTDPRWTAGLSIPLRGTMPRHRVVARFVRERRWASVWSLNWDTHLENALERIGFRREVTARPGQPWQTKFQTVLTREDFPFLGDNQYFCVLKPHGCVRSLKDAKSLLDSGDVTNAKRLSDRLMITEHELSASRENPTDVQFFSELKTALGRSPLIVLGWSISEPYLAGVINDTIVPLLKRAELEELTIIDPMFNDAGHTKAAHYYALTREQTFAELETNLGGVGADEFLIWLQAKYALQCLSQHVDPVAKPALDAAIDVLRRPLSSHYLLSWCDDFLPAWTRLCWRADLVHCAGYQSHELRLEDEDFHIPWSLPPLVRPDLTSAANILTMIRTSGLDFSTFPGGAWDGRRGQLTIPLPAWAPGSLDDLGALKPLVTAIKSNLGFVRRVEILPVGLDPNMIFSAATIADLKGQISRLMPVLRFSDPANIATAVDLREA
jgi:hypothetical protein